MNKELVARVARRFVQDADELTVQTTMYIGSHRELQLLVRAGGPVSRMPLKLVFLGTSHCCGSMHCQGKPTLVETRGGAHELRIEADGGRALRIVADFLSDFDPERPDATGTWIAEPSQFYRDAAEAPERK